MMPLLDPLSKSIHHVCVHRHRHHRSNHDVRYPCVIMAYRPFRLHDGTELGLGTVLIRGMRMSRLLNDYFSSCSWNAQRNHFNIDNGWMDGWTGGLGMYRWWWW